MDSDKHDRLTLHRNPAKVVQPRKFLKANESAVVRDLGSRIDTLSQFNRKNKCVCDISEVVSGAYSGSLGQIAGSFSGAKTVKQEKECAEPLSLERSNSTPQRTRLKQR
jgi:hypothetical protein